MSVKKFTFVGAVLKTFEDPEGNITTFEYDDFGRKSCETKGKIKTLFFYDSCGRLNKTQIGKSVQVSIYNYANYCIEKRIENLVGETFEKENYGFDELGNQTHITNSKGTEIIVYNCKGQPVEIIDACGNKTIFSYAYKGQFTKKITNPKEIQTVFVHDCRGRVSETYVLNKAKEVISKSTKKYDFAGNLKEEELFVFEGKCLVKSILNTWSYGPCNKIKSSTEGGSKTTLYEYDKWGRLEKKTKPDKAILTYVYDKIGRLKRHYSSDFDYHYTYDNCDRIREVCDSKNNKTIRHYDENGNISDEQLCNGLTNTVFYNEEGQREKCLFCDGSEVFYKYQVGRLCSITRNHLTHTYSKRDLEGNISEMILPSNLGKVSIDRDVKSRWKNVSSPYFSQTFSQNAYDSCGNLCHYSFIDALGPTERHFCYDDLNQLSSENEHQYTFDSIHNCILKDGIIKEYNSLCQEVNQEMKYDPNGNLKSDSRYQYDYDSLDRLIKVYNDDVVISYTYDAFNRRVSKNINGEMTRYIWDDKNEIGSTDSSGNIQELRILGEGLGAEIGSAVLLEIEGKTYVPLHDHIGNVVTMIDIASRQVHLNRFSAFGKSSNKDFPSPWTFSSKRCDPETGYLYFGRRYYCPDQSRWLTADPEGFTDGPNLYSYVSNNPLTHFDLYGLKGILNDIWDYFSNGKFTFFESQPDYKKHSCNHYYPEFESKCPIKSSAFNLGLEAALGISNLYINGVRNNFCRDTAPVSETLGSKIKGNLEGIYYSTQGAIKDVFCCMLSLIFGKMTPAAILIKEKLEQIHTTLPLNKIFVFCHSAGAIHVRNALRHLTGDIQKKILVIAIAPAAYISKNICLDVIHLTSKRDFVPLLDFKGRRACCDTIRELEPHPEAPFFDHTIVSPTYSGPIQDAYDKLYEKHVEVK